MRKWPAGGTTTVHRWIGMLLLLACVSVAEGHTHYFAHTMSGDVLNVPTSSEATGQLEGDFFPNDDRGRPTCLTDTPFSFRVSLQGLEGEVTSYVFHLETQDGPELARLTPEAKREFYVDSSVCDVLRLYDDGSVGGDSGLFFIVETDAHPTGEVGARLKLDYSQPTLSASWGEIKRTYR